MDTLGPWSEYGNPKDATFNYDAYADANVKPIYNLMQ